MDAPERMNRIVARGEVSGHAHIITGECEITKTGEVVTVKAGKDCAIKHLLEIPFVEEGKEVWTQEHTDIPLRQGESYQIIQQIEFNPYAKAIRNVTD
jgi:hypothetical protein